jgi:hypothetical protein
VIQISRLAVIASDVMNMFFISDIKCLSHLSNVFQWTI